MRKEQIARAQLALSVLGVIIAIYLVLEYYSPSILVCPTYGLIDCAKVLNSSYAVTLGVPNAIMGLVFYIVEVLLLLFLKDGQRKDDILVFYSALGIGTVVYFVYLEYLLHAICPYCTAEHIIALTFFVLAVMRVRKKN